MVVRRLSSGKREMRRMPETPADNFAQLSSLPTPSEVTTPMPVTAIIGRPALSRCALAVGRDDVMKRSPSIHPVKQHQPFTPPIADAGDDGLGKTGRTLSRIARTRWGEQLAVLDHRAAKRKIGHELGVHSMP